MFRKGKFWKVFKLKRKNWHWNKEGGNSIKRTTKVNFVKVKPRVSVDNLYLFQNQVQRYLCFQYQETICCFSVLQMCFLASFRQPSTVIGVSKMVCKCSPFLWSMSFISALVIVFVSYWWCCNDLPSPCGLKQHTLIIVWFGKSVVQLGFYGAKINMSAGMCFLLSALGENSLFCLFQLLEASCIPWLVTPSSVCKASHCLMLSSVSIITPTLPLVALPPPFT